MASPYLHSFALFFLVAQSIFNEHLYDWPDPPFRSQGV